MGSTWIDRWDTDTSIWQLTGQTNQRTEDIPPSILPILNVPFSEPDMTDECWIHSIIIFGKVKSNYTISFHTNKLLKKKKREEKADWKYYPLECDRIWVKEEAEDEEILNRVTGLYGDQRWGIITWAGVTRGHNSEKQCWHDHNHGSFINLSSPFFITAIHRSIFLNLFRHVNK